MDHKRTIATTLLILTVSVHLSSGGSHILEYVHTAKNCPKYSYVGKVDEQEFVYYDSSTRNIEKIMTEWIDEYEGADYWTSETEKLQDYEDLLRKDITTLMKHFNQDDGSHTVKWTYGCELHDDGSRTVNDTTTYDGNIILRLDLHTVTWTAADSIDLSTKQKIEASRPKAKDQKYYLESTCIERLKQYNNSGASLERKGGGRRHKRSTDDNSDCAESGSYSPQRSSYSLQRGSHSLQRGSHSLQYFYTAVTKGLSFPEFTAVGLVDGEQFVYYDSNIKKTIPKTEWIEKNEDPDYWDRNTLIFQGTQESFINNVAVGMERFNQTKGVHTVQVMYSCELDDDGKKRGYNQQGYDGEDFISLDLNTLTWTAAKAQAVITKHKWDVTERGVNAAQQKNYLENTCIEWLQKYVSYSRATLERKVPPEVSLFQKDSSSPVVCHATGFFPRAVMISWEKNGEDLHENVELTETLPNQDGTFQKRSILRVSPEELNKNDYTCVVQHSGLEKDLVLPFNSGVSIGIIVGAVLAVLLLVLVGVGVFFIWMKKKKEKGYKTTAGSDGEASSTSSN